MNALNRARIDQYGIYPTPTHGEPMTFKELAEQILKDNPEGMWVHFGNFPDGWGEVYLDEDYQKEFESVLDKEVADYYIDECGYDLLEVFLNAD